jgi:hypothetical protein
VEGHVGEDRSDVAEGSAWLVIGFSFSEGVHAASKLVCGSWTASQRSIGIGGSNPDATFSLDLPHTF